MREERQLLARLLVIQETRQAFIPKLQYSISNFEMAVIPRQLFATDGTLLLTTNKSKLLQTILDLVSCTETEDENVPLTYSQHLTATAPRNVLAVSSQNVPVTSSQPPVVPTVSFQNTQASILQNVPAPPTQHSRISTIIFDAMVLLQS